MIKFGFYLVCAFLFFGWSRVRADLAAAAKDRAPWTFNPSAKTKFLVWMTWWYRPILEERINRMPSQLPVRFVTLSLLGSAFQLFVLALIFASIGLGLRYLASRVF